MSKHDHEPLTPELQEAIDLLRDCEEFVKHAAHKSSPQGRAPEVYDRLLKFLRPYKDT